MHVEFRSELSVITKSKDLCNYILTITDKSPKKFRFTLVSRLQNYVLSIIEALIKANEIYVYSADKSIDMNAVAVRTSLQRDALTELKLLSYMAQVAMEQQCILPKQYEQITRKIYDCQNLLGAWMKSDAKRFQKRS